MEFRYVLVSCTSIALLFLIWTSITVGGLVDRAFLPSPVDLWNAFLGLVRYGYADTPLVDHVLASLARTFTGFGLACLIGIPTGVVMGWSRFVAAVLTPLMAFLRPIPPIAFVPLFILYFGIGETGKVLVIFMVAFWYITLNVSAGVAGLPEAWVLAGRNLGLNHRQLFTAVILPAATPEIFTGIRIGIAVSWALVVAAELIAAQEGLGHIILDAAMFNRTNDVFVGIVLIGLIGLLLEGLVTLAERRLLHWRGK